MKKSIAHLILLALIVGMPTLIAVGQESAVDPNLQLILETMNQRFDSLENRIAELKNDLESDINDLEIDLREVKTDLNAKIDTVKTDLNAKIDTVKTDLNTKVDDTFALWKWVVGFVFLVIATVIAAVISHILIKKLEQKEKRDEEINQPKELEKSPSV